MKKDEIYHPDHYTRHSIETIDYIESEGLGEASHHANILRYLGRWRYKGTPLKDLKKARVYINRLIKLVEEKDG